MYSIRNVNSDIVYIGIEDRRLHLFENLFPLDRGVTYNSYLIKDNRTALLDTVDQTVGRQFFENLEHALAGRPLDYLIINHMEPDHCALIEDVFRRYPDVIIVSSQKTFQMIGQFFTTAVPQDHRMIVNEGDELPLGKHTLTFMMAPMVHWPEVMFTFDKTDGILFSADAFGVFGTNNGNIFSSETDYKAKDFVDDARRYYSNIVGKYGLQTQNALKKAAGMDIRMICPLHGPIWDQDLCYIINLYDKWSRYEPEDKAVAVFYNSVYGNTESAVNAAAMLLGEKGVRNIKAYDVSKTDVSVMIAECFRVSNILIAATTYNNGLFPKMEALIADMKALTVRNRKYSIIENGSWAPQSGKIIQAAFAEMKGMELVGTPLAIKSSTFNYEALDQLAEAIKNSLS